MEHEQSGKFNKQPEGLIEQRDFTSTFVERRRNLYEAIAPSISVAAGNEDWDKVIKIGRVRSRVDASLKRGEAHLLSVNEQIDKQEQEKNHDEQLIIQAQGYQNELNLGEQRLAGLRMYAAHLQPEVLAGFEEKHEALIQRKEADPELQRGFQLLAQRQEEERLKAQEAEQVPTAFVTPTSDAQEQGAMGLTEEGSAEQTAVILDQVIQYLETKANEKQPRRERSTEDRFRKFTIQFPNGRKEEVQGAITAEIARYLICAYIDNRVLISTDLSEAVYGSTDKSFTTSLTQSISRVKGVRDIFIRAGYSINQLATPADKANGIPGMYLVEPLQPNTQKAEQVVSPVADIAPEVEIAQPSDLTEESIIAVAALQQDALAEYRQLLESIADGEELVKGVGGPQVRAFRASLEAAGVELGFEVNTRYVKGQLHISRREIEGATTALEDQSAATQAPAVIEEGIEAAQPDAAQKTASIEDPHAQYKALLGQIPAEKTAEIVMDETEYDERFKPSMEEAGLALGIRVIPEFRNGHAYVSWEVLEQPVQAPTRAVSTSDDTSIEVVAPAAETSSRTPIEVEPTAAKIQELAAELNEWSTIKAQYEAQFKAGGLSRESDLVELNEIIAAKRAELDALQSATRATEEFGDSKKKTSSN